MNTFQRLISALTFSTIVLLGFASNTTVAQNQQPVTIPKDTVLVTLETFNAYRKNEDVYSWAPDLRFRIRGPVGNDDLVYVEYNVPGSPVLRFDCPVRDEPRGARAEVKCSS